MAVERVKQFVVAGSDVPAAFELGHIKSVVNDFFFGDRERRVLAHSLRHALLVTDGAAIERRDGFIFVQVPTPAPDTSPFLLSSCFVLHFSESKAALKFFINLLDILNIPCV